MEKKNDQAYKHYHSVKTHLTRKGGPFSSSSKHFELESFLKDLSNLSRISTASLILNCSISEDIIKRWSEAELFTMLENYNYIH